MGKAEYTNEISVVKQTSYKINEVIEMAKYNKFFNKMFINNSA